MEFKIGQWVRRTGASWEMAIKGEVYLITGINDEGNLRFPHDRVRAYDPRLFEPTERIDLLLEEYYGI